jgi:hypothetical protein
MADMGYAGTKVFLLISVKAVSRLPRHDFRKSTGSF